TTNGQRRSCRSVFWPIRRRFGLSEWCHARNPRPGGRTITNVTSRKRSSEFGLVQQGTQSNLLGRRDPLLRLTLLKSRIPSSQKTPRSSPAIIASLNSNAALERNQRIPPIISSPLNRSPSNLTPVGRVTP